MSMKSSLNSDENHALGRTWAYGTIFIWQASLLFWRWTVGSLAGGVENVFYCVWAAGGVTVLVVAKRYACACGIPFSEFVGRDLKSRDLVEVAIVSMFSILAGVGFWAALVLLEAKISPAWTYRWWALASQSEFAQVAWRKDWIILEYLTGAVLVPVTEEIVFRGLVFRMFLHRYGVHKAIVFSALIFALFHLNKSFVGSFFHGVVFAILLLRLSSLYAPILAHCTYNAAIFTMQIVFGFSVVAERDHISSALYWAPEFLCLVIGLSGTSLYIYGSLRKVAKGNVTAGSMPATVN